MFRIRSSQLDQFGSLARGGFEERMTTYFVESFPRETEHLDVADWVSRNVRAGLERGFEMEREVAQYLLLCLRLGEDAPAENAFFGEVLKRRDLAADGKLRVLVQKLNEQGTADIERFTMKPFA